MNYTSCIPKNYGHHLSSRLYGLRLLLVHPMKSIVLTVPSSRVWSNGSMFRPVINRRKNSSGLHWNISKHCSKIVTRPRLWFTVSKRSTYLADSFFISNCSCKIEITVLCDMPVTSTSSRFTRRSVKTISWTLSMISGVAPQLDVPNEVTCVWPCLNSFTQLYTIANASADVLWTLSNSALISFVKSFICRCLMHGTRFFLFCKKYKGSL